MSYTPTDQNLKSLNDFRDIFLPFKKKLPTIEEALKELGLNEKDAAETARIAKSKAECVRKLHKLILTDDEIAAIYVYTTSLNDDPKKPYQYINEALSSPNKSEEIPKVRKYLALLLSALRKLPRQFPPLYVLYRGISVPIPIQREEDEGGINPGESYESEASKGHTVVRGRAAITPYIKGCEKVWWSFTSTTGTLSEAKRFTKEIIQKDLDGKPIKGSGINNNNNSNNGSNPQKGTLFIITMAWGYDISIFSEHEKEKEYLIEPERKFTIEGILETSDGLTVSTKFNETPLVLQDIFPPKYTKAVPTELPINTETPAPDGLRLAESWCNGAAFYWNKCSVKGHTDVDPDIIYQVGIKKKKLLGGSIVPMDTVHDVPTVDKPFIVGPLKADTTYVAYVRVGTPAFYSPWSKQGITFDTPKIEDIGTLDICNTYSNKVSIRWREVSCCPQYPISYEIQNRDVNEPKAEYERVGISKSMPYVHEFEDNDTKKYEYRVRALIEAQSENGTPCCGRWSSLGYGGPVENICVEDIKCEYSAEHECVNLSWSPVKVTALNTPVAYTVAAHNTSRSVPIYNGKATSCSFSDIEFGGTYAFFVRAKVGVTLTKLDKPNAQITLPLKKEFPGEFRPKLGNSSQRFYSLSKENPAIAISELRNQGDVAVVVTNTVVPIEKPSTWSIRVHTTTGLIYFGIAPVCIRSVTTSMRSLKYGWFADPINGMYCVGTENTHSDPKFKVSLNSVNFKGVGMLKPGDVITVTFTPNNLGLSFSYNGMPLNDGKPVHTGIDPGKLIIPAVMMTGNGTVIELMG